MLDSIAGISTLLFIGVGGWVGVRLLVLARRTRGLPEMCLGFSMLLIVGVGYALYIVPMVLKLSDAFVSVCSALGILAMSAGWIACWLFTWRVFRPHAPAALIASCVAIAVIAISGAAHAVQVIQDEQLRLSASDPTWTIIRLCALTVYLWCGIESARYWSMMKKRVGLGLADPVVANRFLLWATVMGVSFSNIIVPTVAAVMGAPDESAGMRLWISLTGFVTAAALYLAFLPPRAYRERILAASGVATA